LRWGQVGYVVVRWLSNNKNTTVDIFTFVKIKFNGWLSSEAKQILLQSWTDVSGFDRQTAVSNYLEHLEMFNNRAVAFFGGCVLNLPNIFLGVPYFKASKIVAVSCLKTQKVAPKTKKWYLIRRITILYHNLLLFIDKFHIWR
jgi:hypothetical protein